MRDSEKKYTKSGEEREKGTESVSHHCRKKVEEGEKGVDCKRKKKKKKLLQSLRRIGAVREKGKRGTVAPPKEGKK